MSKPWYRSKVIWTNIISTAVAILSLFVEPGMLVGLGVPDALAANYQAKLMLALAIANIILRKLTTQPVRVGGRP